jgi:hypothetical protein
MRVLGWEVRCTTRLLDHANRCILAVVDGHVPIYYTAMEVEPDTHRPKRWQLTDVMDDGPPHPRSKTQDEEEQCPSTSR